MARNSDILGHVRGGGRVTRSNWRGPLPLVLTLALVAWAGPAPKSSSVTDFRSRQGVLTQDLNVLLITLDTTRADRLGCYGYGDAETPHIDRLASNGIRFAQAVAQSPLTLPSHASIMTGTYPTHHRVQDNGRTSVSQELTTLAEIFQQKGFATGAFVGAFVLDSRFGLDQGFDVYDDDLQGEPFQKNELARERSGAAVTARATAWLKKVAPSNRFFGWVHLFDPHADYRPPPPYAARHASQPYDGEIAFSDHNVGRLLETLESLGMRKHTLVVFLSDHGESFGEHDEDGHGIFLYDTTLLVPLILSWPEALPVDIVVTRQVRTVDVAPTLLDIFGFKIPPAFQGRSLLDLFFEPDGENDRPAFAESIFAQHNFGWAPLRALRTGRWKYIEAPTPELYDLNADPTEHRNLVEEDGDTARRLAAQLESLMREQGASPVAPPAVSLDAQDILTLQSLGYLRRATSSPQQGQEKDPKAMIASLKAFEKAKALMSQRRFTEAIKLLEPLTRESSESTEFHFQLGLAHARLKQWSQAEASLVKVIQLDPEFLNGKALVNLGAVYRERGELVPARELFEQALSLNPHEGVAHLNLGALENQLGNTERSLAHYKKFLELLPNHHNAVQIRKFVRKLERARATR